MKKTWINYWVDMVIGVAFILCAVTGLFRLFPDATVSVSSSGQPVILGISTSVWQVIHDWSGFLMTAGVGLHLALHFRWMVAMTGKALRGGKAADTGRTRPSRRQATPGTLVAPPAAARVPATAAVSPVAMSAGHDDGATALARLEAMGGQTPAHSRRSRPSRPDAPRYSRKGFLVAGSAVGIAAFMAGCGLLGGSDDKTTSTTSYSDDTHESYDSDSDSDNGSGSSQNSDNSDSTQVSSSGSDNGSSTTTSARVVVDANRCTGCGNCVQTCPYGVFTLSGGRAVVQNANACRLCGRCLRTCAPAAITLNG